MQDTRERGLATEEVVDVEDLIDSIGAGVSDPSNHGPVAVFLSLWDGRRVKGTYYKGEQHPSISTPKRIIFDDETLTRLVMELLRKGKSFITKTGTDDTVCVLQWTIGN